MITHSGRSAVALAGELLSSGSRVMIVTADARRRSRLAALAAGPSRFGGTHAVVCGSCGGEAAAAAAAAPSDGGADLLLVDWEALAADPAIGAGFQHAICVDPAGREEQLEALAQGSGGWLHETFARDDLAVLCWAERWEPRPALAEIYRGAVAAPVSGEPLGALLAGTGTYRRDAAIAARCVRVLVELGLCELAADADARSLRVVSSEKTELERSGVWRALSTRHEEGLRFLRSRTAS